MFKHLLGFSEESPQKSRQFVGLRGQPFLSCLESGQPTKAQQTTTAAAAATATAAAAATTAAATTAAATTTAAAATAAGKGF